MEIDYRIFYSRVEQTRMEYNNKLQVFTKREVGMLDLFAVLMSKILPDLYASEDEEDDPVEVDETKEGSETEAKEDDTAISEEKDDDDYTEVEDSEDTKTPKDSISSEDEAESVEETKSRDEL